VRCPVFIFPSTLTDLGRVWLVSSSASLPIGGVRFFGFIIGGGDFGVKLMVSFWAIDFVDGIDILPLQESSGGPRAVLVRYVFLLQASFGLEFPVLGLGSLSSPD
jgi:hypothetical protein